MMTRASRSSASTAPAVLKALGLALAATMLAPLPGHAQAPGMPVAAVEAGGSTLPAVTGANAVGRTEFALVDAGRVDSFADDGRPRELAVWIWYPTAGRGGTAAPYLPAEWTTFAGGVGPLMQDLAAVRGGSIANAALEGRPPAVVFMPGLGQPVASYTALAEELASQGYAVVAINPTGSTDVVFPDGHAVTAMPRGAIDPALLTDLPAWQVEAGRVTSVWVADAGFVVGTLAATPPAIGALDFDRTVYVGHSLGGAAAFEACRLDAACVGAVDLDGTLWTDVRFTGLAVPNLVLRHEPAADCDAFCQAADADFATVRAAGNSMQYAIAGSLHMSFTDLGLVPSPGNIPDYRGALDPERMILITRDLVRTLLDTTIRSAPGTSVSDAAERYPDLSRL